MGGGAFLGLIPKLPDFAGAGLDFAVGGLNAKRVARKQRHLNRRVYEDQIISLKRAGLNPILAVGAQPATARAQFDSYAQGGASGIGGTFAENQFTGQRKEESRSKVETNLQQIAVAQEQEGLVHAQANNVRAQTQNLDQAKLTSAAQQQLFEAQAIKEGASAKEVRERIRALQLQNVGADIEADFDQSGAGRVLRGVNRVSQAIQGVARSGNTAAQAAEVLRQGHVRRGRNR